MTESWYAAYLNKPVGYVLVLRSGKFRPIIATAIESEGDDDCFMVPTHSRAPLATLDEALAELDNEPNLHRVFRQPVELNSIGTWLWVLVKAADGKDPRQRAA